MKPTTTSMTLSQFLVAVLAGTVIAVANPDPEANFRRHPAPATLAECLKARIPNFYSGGKPSVQVIKDCMGQVSSSKREIGDDEADVDVTDYVIDGGKKNVIV
ncbi:hypothetical protein FB567DRAFT_337730 [Paraphoma chrysanthemicola]|uniref:Uncharacterized protein n=1 Tax=Paraphoma chrysanthemicola TaxID=798071 RepID=A0A8K0R6Y7_9PLEO|nr:hypothetical protein FB567DRAFT_337730 [Paraphoma chrysanthemicola]